MSFFAVLVLVVALAAGAPGGSAAPLRVADNARIFCAIEHGPTWTAVGRSGSTWYVAGLTTRSECENSANWATILGKRIVDHDGAAVRAFRSGEYGCVVDRTSLEASCYLGNGGAGAVGVVVIGNYPCELADPIFKVFLANLTSSSAAASLTAAQLHRNGWSCEANRTDLLTICRFTPELYLDTLRAGVGYTVPGSFRVGIAAALPHGAISRVGAAIDASA